MSCSQREYRGCQGTFRCCPWAGKTSSCRDSILARAVVGGSLVLRLSCLPEGADWLCNVPDEGRYSNVTSERFTQCLSLRRPRQTVIRNEAEAAHRRNHLTLGGLLAEQVVFNQDVVRDLSFHSRQVDVDIRHIRTAPCDVVGLARDHALTCAT